jgi:hypothetical protein
MDRRHHNSPKAIAAAPQRDRAKLVISTSALVLGLVLVLIISLTGSGSV